MEAQACSIAPGALSLRPCLPFKSTRCTLSGNADSDEGDSSAAAMTDWEPVIENKTSTIDTADVKSMVGNKIQVQASKQHHGLWGPLKICFATPWRIWRKCHLIRVYHTWACYKLLWVLNRSTDLLQMPHNAPNCASYSIFTHPAYLAWLWQTQKTVFDVRTTYACCAGDCRSKTGTRISVTHSIVFKALKRTYLEGIQENLQQEVTMIDSVGLVGETSIWFVPSFLGILNCC